MGGRRAWLAEQEDEGVLVLGGLAGVEREVGAGLLEGGLGLADAGERCEAALELGVGEVVGGLFALDGFLGDAEQRLVGEQSEVG